MIKIFECRKCWQQVVLLKTDLYSLLSQSPDSLRIVYTKVQGAELIRSHPFGYLQSPYHKIKLFQRLDSTFLPLFHINRVDLQMYSVWICTPDAVSGPETWPEVVHPDIMEQIAQYQTWRLSRIPYRLQGMAAERN